MRYLSSCFLDVSGLWECRECPPPNVSCFQSHLTEDLGKLALFEFIFSFLWVCRCHVPISPGSNHQGALAETLGVSCASHTAFCVAAHGKLKPVGNLHLHSFKHHIETKTSLEILGFSMAFILWFLRFWNSKHFFVFRGSVFVGMSQNYGSTMILQNLAWSWLILVGNQLDQALAGAWKELRSWGCLKSL